MGVVSVYITVHTHQHTPTNNQTHPHTHKLIHMKTDSNSEHSSMFCPNNLYRLLLGHLYSYSWKHKCIGVICSLFVITICYHNIALVPTVFLATYICNLIKYIFLVQVSFKSTSGCGTSILGLNIRGDME